MPEVTRRLRSSDVRAEWHWLKERVEKLCASCSKDWRPEDVYYELRAGNAHLFVNDDPKGFLVVQQCFNEYTTKPFMFIWLAQGDGTNMIREFWDEIMDMARATGNSIIRFKSPRDGWHRVENIELVMSEFEIKVPE